MIFLKIKKDYLLLLDEERLVFLLVFDLVLLRDDLRAGRLLDGLLDFLRLVAFLLLVVLLFVFLLAGLLLVFLLVGFFLRDVFFFFVLVLRLGAELGVDLELPVLIFKFLSCTNSIFAEACLAARSLLIGGKFFPCCS